MKIFDNITETVRDDLAVTIKKGSCVSMAAACFSIYAYNELKKQLEGVDEFRFIFRSPTFIKEKANKQKREFYIPRFNHPIDKYTDIDYTFKMKYRLKVIVCGLPKRACRHSKRE